MPKRPNILILMSDEHRADAAGFAGDPVARTPTLDWLAEGGVTFTQAIAPSPICVPARQCVLSGQYPWTCGCDGWKDLRPGHCTYPSTLGRWGYRNAAFGKMHLIGPDQLQGWQRRPCGDVACLQVDDPVERCPETDRIHADDPLNCPGTVKWSDRKELLRAGPGPGHHQDGRATDAFCDWIEEAFVDPWYDRAQPETPTMAYLGLHDPHYPYQCSEDLFAHYLPRVRGFRVETPFEHPFLGLSTWPPEPLQAGVHVPARSVQRARAAYYGMIETMDFRCGRAIQAIRAAGQDPDDWILVYLSDHGEQLGEHGVWEKQKFFSGSVRVPFIIRAPRHLPQGARIDSTVSTCDLFPTLCELAGIPIPDGLDGRSLVELAHGRSKAWPDEACSFFLQQGWTNGLIQRGRLKYHWYHHRDRGELPEVLFDLDADPDETRNHIDEPVHAVAVESLRRRRAELETARSR